MDEGVSEEGSVVPLKDDVYGEREEPEVPLWLLKNMMSKFSATR